MPTQINGLPAHVLLIHVIIVLVPLGALFTVLSAVWPAAHRKLGFISPLTCLIALAFVPVTTHAGEWLEHKLEQGGENPAIEKHADLGDTFLWYALVLFVVSAAVWWLGRTYDLRLRPAARTSDPDRSAGNPPSSSGRGGLATLTAARPQAAKQALPVWAPALVAVIAIATAVVVVWQLYRVGDAGAHAAWDYVHQLNK